MHPVSENKEASRNKESLCLVLDIGGTNLRAATYDAVKEELIAINYIPTPSFLLLPDAKSHQEIYDALLVAIQQLTKNLLHNVQPKRVCFAFPGPIDADGCIVTAPTIWSHAPPQPFNLREDLKQIWPEATITLMNDVTAAGYRYKEDEDFCIVSVGSGIGNKVFIQGEPIVGINGRGGEIGHARVDFSEDALKCDCGEFGHLGAIASGRGTLRQAIKIAKKDREAFENSWVGSKTNDDPDSLTNEILVAGYHSDDPWSVYAVHFSATYLAVVLASLHQALGLERFVLVGGFALALGEKYRKYLAETANKSCWNIGQDWECMVKLGHDDDYSGLIGAGRAVTPKDNM